MKHTKLFNQIVNWSWEKFYNIGPCSPWWSKGKMQLLEATLQFS